MRHVVLILTIISTTAFAQKDEAAVKETVNLLFEGLKRGDTALMRSVFSKTAILQTVVKNSEGAISVTSTSLDSFLISIAGPHPFFDERIHFESVKIDGELAAVWAPYKFYIGDRFSHCGTDAFQLIRIKGQWKIQYLIDTRRRQGCE